VEGDYEKYDKTMPTKQYNALMELINNIKSRYTGLTVKGHGELYPTACPGEYYPLDTIKKLFNKNAAMDLNTTIGFQTALKRLGFYVGAIDGVAGPKTVEAVRQFQTKYGLVVDGVVGVNTKGKIKEVLK
jgi:N-acetyl-anhydromuramyl-L-alanine amidase AmpD